MALDNGPTLNVYLKDGNTFISIKPVNKGKAFLVSHEMKGQIINGGKWPAGDRNGVVFSSDEVDRRTLGILCDWYASDTLES